MCQRWRFLLHVWLVLGVVSAAAAQPLWVVQPGIPGPDMPPVGRSLFDRLTFAAGEQRIPFPFEVLIADIERRLSTRQAYLDAPLKKLLIPLGRSLQRNAAAPAFLRSPRLLIAVDSESSDADGAVGPLLRDRLYIAYLQAADVLEVISYNEQAGRFEFQVVADYREGSTPTVRYARRVVCTACHQNAAPIFARPLWDETNANAAVSKALLASGSDFHGIDAGSAVDIAYAIDNASNRANGFALTQLLWQRGCAGEGAVDCRTQLLYRALQSALRDGRGFDDTATSFVDAVVEPMRRQQQRFWPDGLLIPDANIPNRRPLTKLPLEAGGQAVEESDLMLAADVTAANEPLLPRAPAQHWQPTARELAMRAVEGLRQFLARGDIERLDDALASAPTASYRVPLACTTETHVATSRTRHTLSCTGHGTGIRAVVTRRHDDKHIKVRVSELDFDDGATPTHFSALRGEIRYQPGEPAVFYPRLAQSGLRLRATGGDVVQALELPGTLFDNAPATPLPGELAAQLVIRREADLLEAAVARAARNVPQGFDAEPFLRDRLMPPLLAALSVEVPRYACCSNDEVFPAPRVTVSDEGPVADPDVAPFLRACGACHRATEHFPPNFLWGDAAQIRRQLGQCAQRIRYRLAMWDLPAQARQKSTMPPQQAGPLVDTDLAIWRRGPLRELRDALERIEKQSVFISLPGSALLATRYPDLRPCLAPTSTPQHLEAAR